MSIDEATAEPSPTITNAERPFDRPDADVILRSSDNVDFRVSKVHLSMASPFFKDMFALPQGPADGTAGNQVMKEGAPVIQITEKSAETRNLLVLCYPIAMVFLGLGKDYNDMGDDMTFEDALVTLQAAIKYGMEDIEGWMKWCIFTPPIVERHAMEVFAYAHHHGWEEETRIAAKCTLRQSPTQWSHVPELETITGGDYHRLLRYHQECSKAAKQVATKDSWNVGTNFVGFQCPQCRDTERWISAVLTIRVNVHPNRWWTEFMDVAADAVAQRPCGDTLLEPGIMDTTLLKIQCDSCIKLPNLASEMRIFIKRFAEEIEQAVSLVSDSDCLLQCAAGSQLDLVRSPSRSIRKRAFHSEDLSVMLGEAMLR